MTSGAEVEKLKEIISKEEYKTNLSYALRALNHSNRVITALTFVYVVYTRSLAAAYFGAGALGCVVVVKVCKQFLREARPAGTTYKVSYGMPSTHSATISYYAAFITLAARNLPVHPTLSSVPLFLINPVAPVLAVSCASVVCVSRIRLGHHTIKQVAAGICVGVVFGTGWFWLWSKGGAQDIARGLVDLLPNFISTLVR